MAKRRKAHKKTTRRHHKGTSAKAKIATAIKTLQAAKKQV